MGRLRRFLEDLPLGTDICIGTKEGSGWVFFGKSEDTFSVSKFFHEYVENSERWISESEIRLMNLVSKPPKLITEKSEKKRCEKEKVKPRTLQQIEEYNNGLLISRACTIAAIVRGIHSRKGYISNYKSVLDRNVVEHYKKEVDGPRIAIIVEGAENGSYWTKEEFDKAQEFEVEELKKQYIHSLGKEIK